VIAGRKKGPTLDQSEARARAEREPAPDAIDYYADQDRWQELGKQVQRDAAEHRRTGVEPAGMHTRLAAFRSLRKRLDRRAR